jgi:DNA-binding LacI/PurR family transcriptional regulator
MPKTKSSDRVTLAAVAAAARTSVPTVSKVLRGGTDVSKATRDRVMEAAQTVGYVKRERPAGHSAGFHPEPLQLIDLVVNHVAGTWPNGVLTGVEDAASAANLDVVLTLARGAADWVPRLLRRPTLGAIIVLVDPSRAQFAALQAAGVPIVMVDPMSHPQVNLPSVGVTNWDGGRSAAEHLIGLGHTNVAIIGGDRLHQYSQARIDGFRTAFESAGVPRPQHVSYADWDRARAREEALHTLSGTDPRPTAIFACSDVMALGVYDAARELGLRIPSDLSVVGFDDVPEAQWAFPQMTTVHQPLAQMGSASVNVLLQLRAAATSTSQFANPRVDLATKLVMRESTAPPRASSAPT